jgi:uncharacterized protein YycO
MRRFLYSLTKKLSIFIGMVHAPYSHKKIKSVDYRRMISFLKPGDIFLTRINGELSNLFIPSHFTHGAIYVGSNFVAEAIGQGVMLSDLIDFALTKDEICVMRPRFCDENIMASAATWARAKLGMPYDFDFDLDNGYFYCFELCVLAYKAFVQFPFEPRPRLGRQTYVGDDFVKAEMVWQVIFDSRESH